MKEEIDVNRLKAEFCEIYSQNIHREGSKELLDYLDKTDFYTCPASTKFHSNFSGGLLLHSLNVYKRFKELLDNEYGANRENVISDESIAIMSLLHDICKTNCYKVEYRNAKVDGEWIKQPYYAYNDELPYGHGEKSVYMISAFMRLTREEAMGINWHMGGYDKRVVGGDMSIATAYYQYPTAVLLHIADVMATYLDEETQK